MIRKARTSDSEIIAQLWYDVNTNAHDFIPQKYWLKQLPMVKKAFKSAEIYVYEKNGHILGLIGLEDNYLAGLFVALGRQSSGIGQKLLSYVKKRKDNLTLKVYQKNKRAVNFYQKNGFKIRGASLDEDNNEEEYLMDWHMK